MNCQKVYDTGLLYHHYANNAYPLTPGSFMAHKVKGDEAVRSLLESEWAKADDLCVHLHLRRAWSPSYVRDQTFLGDEAFLA